MKLGPMAYLALLLISLFSLWHSTKAGYEAQETHKHLHEIACSLGMKDKQGIDHCDWARGSVVNVEMGWR